MRRHRAAGAVTQLQPLTASLKPAEVQASRVRSRRSSFLLPRNEGIQSAVTVSPGNTTARLDFGQGRSRGGEREKHQSHNIGIFTLVGAAALINSDRRSVTPRTSGGTTIPVPVAAGVAITLQLDGLQQSDSVSDVLLIV